MKKIEPRGVAVAYFEALECGDVAAATGMLEPEIIWDQPGGNRFSGRHMGIDGVGALLQNMMEVSQGTFRLAVAGPAMVNGELVAVPVRFSGERDGVRMDMSGIDLLTVHDGLITAVQLFSEDGRAEDEFWGVE